MRASNISEAINLYEAELVSMEQTKILKQTEMAAKLAHMEASRASQIGREARDAADKASETGQRILNSRRR